MTAKAQAKRIGAASIGQFCEMFGSMPSVIPFDTAEDAIALGSQNDSGLGGTVWTRMHGQPRPPGHIRSRQELLRRCTTTLALPAF